MAVARLAGRLSRLAGRGGGTTLPGKVLATIDPGAVSTLAARLPLGTAVVSATNGKTTTASLVAGILSPRIRLAHNSSGANLVSGVASTLLAADGAELGLFEVDEGAFPGHRRSRPAAGGLPRQPVPRPARPLRRARADRGALAGGGPCASGRFEARPQRRRPAGGRSRSRAAGGDDVRPRRSHAREAVSPARRRLEVLPALRHALRICSGLRRPSRGLRLPELRSPTSAARRFGPRGRAHRARRRLLRPGHAGGDAARQARPTRALQRLQRPGRRRPRARAGREPGRDRGGARRRATGVRALRTDRGRRQDRAPAPDQEPCRGERGRADAGRGRRAVART